MDESPSIIIVSSNNYHDILPLCLKNLLRNTEGKMNIQLVTQDFQFEYEGLITHNNFFNESWSKRLLECLMLIETESVVLLFDDYIVSYFDWKGICELEGLLRSQNLDVIKLRNRFYPEQMNKYSYQMSLWRKTSLISVLRDHENPWQSEVWGRVRTLFRKWNSVISDRELVAYHPAGIIKKGAWNNQALRFLSEEDVALLDLQKRKAFNSDDEKSRFARVINLIFCDLTSTLKSLKSIYK